MAGKGLSHDVVRAPFWYTGKYHVALRHRKKAERRENVRKVPLRKNGKYDILKKRMEKNKKRIQEGNNMAEGKKKSNKKKKEGPDLLTVVVVAVAIVLVLILIANYKKEQEGKEMPSGTPTAVPSATAEPGKMESISVTPPAVTTGIPAATDGATGTPEKEETTPVPTEEPVVSLEEARTLVQNNIDLEAGTYTVELLDDHLMIEGAEYYSFCVNDADGMAMEPLLIVEKKEGTLACYDFSGVVSRFSKFPLDKTETGGTETEAITAEEAKKVLSGYSGAALGLAKEPLFYEMTVDDWTTVINGDVCYGINLFENADGKQRFRGVYYVTLDGRKVYSEDGVTGDFIQR